MHVVDLKSVLCAELFFFSSFFLKASCKQSVVDQTEQLQVTLMLIKPLYRARRQWSQGWVRPPIHGWLFRASAYIRHKEDSSETRASLNSYASIRQEQGYVKVSKSRRICVCSTDAIACLAK